MCLILLLADIYCVEIQAQWIKQSPVPTASEITGVWFIDPDTGWILGYDGTVMRTDDGGNTWIDQSLTTADNISSGFFHNSIVGWISFSSDNLEDNGRIYKTTDGGMSWILQFSDSNCAIRDLSFINDEEGWALAFYRQTDPVAASRNFFLGTTDGGDNWICLDTIDRSSFTKIDMINGNLGYIAGAGIPNLMKTTDGGQSWQSSEHSSNAALFDVLFTSATHGYTCGNNFYFSHNAGASWDFSYCYHSHGVGMYDDQNGWTFTINKIFKVAGGGEDLIHQLTVNKSVLSAISVVSPAKVYVTGRHVMILTTDDGGINWRDISSGTHQNLHSVFFLDDNIGWAGGSGRVILNTHDGGLHWNYGIHDVSDEAITGIRFISPDTGWFVNGDVYRSTDGGMSWNKTAGYEYPVSAIHFLHKEWGWCVGTGGRIYQSTDDGANWEEKFSGTGCDLNAVAFIDENFGWIAGDGIVKRTTDGGETWDDSYASPDEFLKIQFLSLSEGYVLSGGFYLETNTGGENWELVVPGGMIGENSLEDLFFIDNENGYLSGDTYLLRTDDGGATWMNDPGLPAMQANAVYFTEKLNGWIVGEDGMIFYTETGGTLSAGKPGHKGESLPFAITPNPTSGVFRISFHLDTVADVDIGIYNLQGDRIRLESLKNQIAGNHIIQWDSARIPAGVYLCQIRSGNFCSSEKIVFIK